MQLANLHQFTTQSPGKELSGERTGGDGELRKAAEQFEAMLLQQMIKAMRDAVPRSNDSSGGAMAKYESLHDRELALQLAERGVLGFADQIEQQLSPGELSKALSVQPATEAMRIRQTTIRPATEPAPPPSAKELNFSRAMAPYAQQAAAKLGIQPEVLIAQAALETGWGRFVPEDADGANSNNMFGIKADHRWQYSSVSQLTTEFVGAQPRKQVASFRAYDTPADSFADYADFVGSQDRYAPALSAKSPRAYLEALQQGGYATDPHYADKVMALLPRIASAQTELALNMPANTGDKP